VARAETVGGNVVEPAREKWGSYGGSFTDPTALWNIAVGAGQPIAAE
jgi:hypothetical protein